MSKNAEPLKILVLGATSAIAMATMRVYARRGASFYLVARSEEKLALVAADVQVRGAAAVHTGVMDLDRTEYHTALLQDAHEKLQGIDIALLAHGVLGEQTAAEQDYRVAEQVMRTNLLSSIFGGPDP